MPFQLIARTGHPDFLELPWDRPLAEWSHERIVEMPRGLHRHVVRFLEYEEGLYVVKELPRRFALREYTFLQTLAEEGVPVVEGVGTVTQRRAADGTELEAVLITRYLEHALPYRLLFSQHNATELRRPLIHALANLLVRIHLIGFMWKDCSLSNTLFRRDAGLLAAYVVDVETGEYHPPLSDGQRAYDLQLAIERCAGELLDLQAAGLLRTELDPAGLAEDLRTSYDAIWDELTREEVFASDQRHKVRDRLERINDLGFDVGELELVGDEDGATMRLRLRVVEPARHERLLRERTGIQAGPEQARALLNDIANFGAWLRNHDGVDHSQEHVDQQWLERSWRSVLDVIPRELRGKRTAPQVFLDAIDHWHRLSESAGADVGIIHATNDFVQHVLSPAPDERVVGRTMPNVTGDDDDLDDPDLDGADVG